MHMQATTDALQQRAKVTLKTWDGGKEQSFELDLDASALEVLDEARTALELGSRDQYRLTFRGRELSDMESLRDARVPDGAELEIYPDVKAG